MLQFCRLEVWHKFQMTKIKVSTLFLSRESIQLISLPFLALEASHILWLMAPSFIVKASNVWLSLSQIISL